MAKTESTAVNELISIMQTQKPLQSDPSEDLLFKLPSQGSDKRARMTASVPARDVPPLPRGRSPVGTSEHPVGVAPSRPEVAVSRSGIPLPRASGPMAMSIPASNPNITLPPLPTSLLRVETERQARPSLPPPARPSRPDAQGTPAPELRARRDVVPDRLTPNTTAPVAMPVAAPFEPRPAQAEKLVATLPLPAPRPSPSLPMPRPTAAAAAAAVPAPKRTLPPATTAARATAVVAPLASPSAPVVARTTKSAPVAKASITKSSPVAKAADMTANHAWFDHAPLADELEPGNTEHVPTHASPVALLGKLAVPMVGLVILGILVGGYVAFSGEGGKPQHRATPKQIAAATPATAPAAAAAAAAVAAPAAVAVAVPAPAAAPAAAPAPAAVAETAPVTETAAAAAAVPVAAHRIELVDVRIDSHPAGATVMLVDRGKTSFLGTTPLAASVDAARRYDLVFTYGNQPTRVEHLDPRATHKVDVVLGGKQAPALPAIATPAAPHVEQHAAPAKPALAAAPMPARAEPRAPVHADAPAPLPEPAPRAPVHHDAPLPAPAEHDAQPVAADGKGTLMISSKPPCQITVDGKDTGLTTPQRSLALSPGVHKVTLTSATDPTVKKTVTVQINAGKPTKVIQDLMK